MAGRATGPEDSISLDNLEVGERAEVCQVPERDSAFLGCLAELKLVPGSSLEIVEKSPLAGALLVKVADELHALAREVAQQIMIKRV
jgi:Fe2+ transport system protein FeoA